MKTITQTIYTYVTHVSGKGVVDYQMTETPGMETQGWILIDEREFSIEVEDIDYAKDIRQKEIDSLVAKQEKASARLLELTS